MNVIAKPVRTAALAANIAAVSAGLVPEEFYTLAYVHLFTNLGGFRDCHFFSFSDFSIL